MDTNKIKFSELSLREFLNFLKFSDINNKQILEVTNDSIYTKAHPSSKSYLIYRRLQNPFTKSDNIDGKILLPMSSTTKLIKVVESLIKTKNEKIDGEFLFKRNGDNNVCSSILFKNKNTSIKLHTSDFEFSQMPFLNDTIWNSILSNETMPCVCSFNVSLEFIKEIQNYTKLFTDSSTTVDTERYYRIILEKDKLPTFCSKKGDSWVKSIDDVKNIKIFYNKDEKIVLNSFLTILDYVSSESDIEVNIKISPNNNYFILIKENENSIFFNTLVKE
jgi:hypothetical protein